METSLKETGFVDQDTLAMNGDVETKYLERRDRLLDAINGTSEILSNLCKFSKDQWVIKYPRFKDSDITPTSPRPFVIHRSLSFADEPSTETEVLVSTPTRAGMKRSVTLTSNTTLEAVPETDCQGSKEDECTELIPDGFRLLRLGLGLGPHGSSV